MKKSELVELIRKVVREEMKVVLESRNKKQTTGFPRKPFNSATNPASLYEDLNVNESISDKIISKSGQLTGNSSREILESYARIKNQEILGQTAQQLEISAGIDELIKKNFGV